MVKGKIKNLTTLIFLTATDNHSDLIFFISSSFFTAPNLILHMRLDLRNERLILLEDQEMRLDPFNTLPILLKRLILFSTFVYTNWADHRLLVYGIKVQPEGLKKQNTLCPKLKDQY